ncbi:MAG: energy-coupling factor ABC transporter ATP-binding protein [Beggiatoa sp. IS2]|nr:MAG: energy-coupling factor ABC transporter ATP-binding protein [Beggiatoa sp. IS2]
MVELVRPVIELRQICFSYRSHPFYLLDQVNMSLYSGERVALMGANGSGKSTLLHLLVGLHLPITGEIEIFGQIRKSERDFLPVRGPLGLLFQDADDQLFCPTVVEDVAFGPLNQGKTRAEVQTIVNETLHILGLTNYAEHLTYQLSGGEKRLVSLATVLAMQPQVLLLDEPTNGLDEETQQRIVHLLQNLPQAMLIVSHDKEFLEKVTHRKILLKRGKLWSKP